MENVEDKYRKEGQTRGRKIALTNPTTEKIKQKRKFFHHLKDPRVKEKLISETPFCLVKYSKI